MNSRTPHVISPARTARQLLPLLAWVAALGLAIGLLLLMGRGGLSTPSVLEPSAWPAWATGRDPLEVAFAVLRLVGLAAAWYLLGVTTIGTAARLLRWGRLVDAADILTVPSVRRLLQTALGLGLATAAVTGTTMSPVGASSSPGPVVAAQHAAEIIPVVSGPVAPATSTQVPPGVSAQALSPLVTDVLPETSAQALPPPAVPTSPALSTQLPLKGSGQALPPLAVPAPLGIETPTPAPPTPAPPAVSAPAPQPVSAPVSAVQTQLSASQERGTYVVQHGDHLWGIAEKTLEKTWGHSPTDAQVIPYWEQLISTNRAALIDPGNPDLILPGQTFTLPTPPPAPGS
jgi:LysM repeat protein